VTILTTNEKRRERHICDEKRKKCEEGKCVSGLLRR